MFLPDYLQAPLQPLMDNLESQTYEAFEKDPVKYSQYQKAIVKALEIEKKDKPTDVTVLMVSLSSRSNNGNNSNNSNSTTVPFPHAIHAAKEPADGAS